MQSYSSTGQKWKYIDEIWIIDPLYFPFWHLSQSLLFSPFFGNFNFFAIAVLVCFSMFFIYYLGGISIYSIALRDFSFCNIWISVTVWFYIHLSTFSHLSNSEVWAYPKHISRVINSLRVSLCLILLLSRL